MPLHLAMSHWLPSCLHCKDGRFAMKSAKQRDAEPNLDLIQPACARDWIHRWAFASIAAIGFVRRPNADAEFSLLPAIIRPDKFWH